MYMEEQADWSPQCWPVFQRLTAYCHSEDGENIFKNVPEVIKNTTVESTNSSFEFGTNKNVLFCWIAFNKYHPITALREFNKPESMTN